MEHYEQLVDFLNNPENAEKTLGEEDIGMDQTKLPMTVNIAN